MANVKRIRKYLGHQFVWVNLLAFILPVFRGLTPGMIAVFGIMVLFQSKLRMSNKKGQLQVLWFSLLFAFYLIAGLWTSNQNELSTELETKLSLIVFPILFVFTKPLPRKVLHRVLFNFVLGCGINIILSLINGTKCFLETGEGACFFSSRFVFGFHPTYMAMYVNMALATLFYFDIFKIRPYKIRQWILRILVFIFIGFNVLLASKMGLITMGMLIIGFALLYYKQNGIKIALIQTLVCLAVFACAMLLSPSTIERFKLAKEGIQSTATHEAIFVENVESTSARIYIWEEAVDLILQHPLFGLGTGDTSDEMAKRYAVRGMTEAAALRLNCHNQFLETQLSVGILGLLSLVLTTLYGAWIGFKRKNYIYLTFSLCCLCNFMAESMLETQAGVVFFAFFNCFFFVQLNQLSSYEGSNGSGGAATVRKGGGDQQGI